MKTSVLESLFNKAVGLKDTFFYRTPSVAASVSWIDKFPMFTLFKDTGEKYLQIKLQRLQKVRIWTFG